MVDQGLAPSRARARAMILAGRVRVDGAVAAKPSARGQGAIAVAADPNPWVSRAGLKLDHALTVFNLTPAGVALDLGASTGGFTQVLLARGVAHVHAVDVGHDQMHQDLLADPRVTCHQGVNVRTLRPGDVPAPDWITADLSFISLEKALPAGLALAKPGAVLVALIKPQFEAGRGAIGKGGIVRDPEKHRVVCERIGVWLGEQGWTPIGLTDSPIAGGDGNAEFLIAAQGPL